MNAELRIARGALAWVFVAGIPASVLAGVFRGWPGMLSVAVSLGLVLGNAGLAALLSAAAGRRSALGPAMIALPSFAFRLVCLFTILALLDEAAFVDDVVFGVAFAAGVGGVLSLEVRAWRRTPWLALAFDGNPVAKEKP